MFPSLIKAQKLNSENKNDSIFAYGTLKALNLNRQNKIITTEQYINGYNTFTKINSVMRVYKQVENGNVVFEKYTSYGGGIIKYENLFNEIISQSSC